MGTKVEALNGLPADGLMQCQITYTIPEPSDRPKFQESRPVREIHKLGYPIAYERTPLTASYF